MPIHPAVVADEPTPELSIAHFWSPSEVPLGLGSPLPLRGGGDRLLPASLSSTSGVDHLPEIKSFVAQACHRQSLLGRDWYHHPPLALIGPSGSGRGLAARWLARFTGLPLLRLSAAGLEALAPSAQWPADLRLPPAPVIAMATARCANPIVLVELDGRSDGEMGDLAKWIDPDLALRWLDERTGGIFDMSQVVWVVQGDALPAALTDVMDASGAVIHLPAPTLAEVQLRSLSIALEACGACAVDHDLVRTVFEQVEAARMRSNGHGRNVACDVLCRVAAASAANARIERPTPILPPDFRADMSGEE